MSDERCRLVELVTRFTELFENPAVKELFLAKGLGDSFIQAGAQKMAALKEADQEVILRTAWAKEARANRKRLRRTCQREKGRLGGFIKKLYPDEATRQKFGLNTLYGTVTEQVTERVLHGDGNITTKEVKKTIRRVRRRSQSQATVLARIEQFQKALGDLPPDAFQLLNDNAWPDERIIKLSDQMDEYKEACKVVSIKAAEHKNAADRLKALQRSMDLWFQEARKTAADLKAANPQLATTLTPLCDNY